MMTSKPMVKVTNGRLSGRYEAQGKIAVFKGIPYAAPPVGARRWRPPTPAPNWQGVYRANQFGNAPLQRGRAIQPMINALFDGAGWSWPKATLFKLGSRLLPRPPESEDCLYLNIRTPLLDPAANLPVMVWLHGGNHQDGSGAGPFYQSNALPMRGVVLVTINYRLGLLGFFAHPELSSESRHGVSGNYGTLDQIEALRWVQENISRFGGDPHNVTVFGQSAGGESVLHMMISPLARGLFAKAIIQSPANGGQFQFLKRPFRQNPAAEKKGAAFAQEFGLSDSHQIDRLRQLSAKKLYEVARQSDEFGQFYPAIDGHVLPQSPFAAFAAGEQANVPFIIGSTADEGTLLLPVYSSSFANVDNGRFLASLQQSYGDLLSEVLRLYPELEKGKPAARAALLGDSLIGAATYFYASKAAKKGGNVYLYQFAHRPHSPSQTLGAYHAADLGFMFGFATPLQPLRGDDKRLSDGMIDYWSSFAKTAVPQAANQPDWRSFAPQSPQWLRFDHEITLEPVQSADKYQLFARQVERLIALA